MEKKMKEIKKEKADVPVSPKKNKNKKYLLLLLLTIPFLIAIGVFGSIAYREGKSILNLAKGNTVVEVKPENIIESLNYTLRDNPTALQKEYFAELKDAVEEEHEEPIDDATIAGMVAKNYIADFYTWTNKYGKYDVGGMEYIYDGEFENSEHFKENVYLWAKDGFYKYMSSYATKYGKENLLEVTDVQVNSRRMSEPYVISEHSAWVPDDYGDWVDLRKDEPYEWFYVQCSWTYKDTSKLDLSKFAKSINLAVIKRNDGRFEIVEASESTINARKGSEENSTVETSEGE